MEDKDNGGRFAYLFAPVKDLAKNFNLDIAKELNQYQEEIKAMTEDIDEDIDLEGLAKFNFAEAGVLIQGSSNVYSRKVDYVHNAAFTFSNSLKVAKKKKNADAEDGEDVSDNEGQDEEDDSADRAKQKRRVRTHEGDPLAFVKIPRITRPYNDPSHYKKIIHKPFLEARFNPLMLREPPSMTVLPESLRPVPDNEKEELCVMGKHLQQTEAAGKFEDFWTLSHTSVVNEDIWEEKNGNVVCKPMPRHSAKKGGCEGCADKDCPDAEYFTKAWIPFFKRDASQKLPENTIYLESANCLLIREGYQHDYSWVRLPDLKPRCSAYNDLIEPVKKERNERLSVLSFANNKVSNDSVFSQALHAKSCSQALSSQPFGSQTLSQPLTHQMSSQDSYDAVQQLKEKVLASGDNYSIDGDYAEDDEDPEFMLFNGQMIAGRASSKLETVRKSIGDGRSGTRKSIQILKEAPIRSLSFGDTIDELQDNADSEPVRNRSTRSNKTADNTGIAQIKKEKEFSLPCRMRDPFDATDSKLLCVPPRKLTVKQRTHNVEKMRAAQAKALKEMSLERRFSCLLNYVDSTDDNVDKLLDTEDPLTWGKRMAQQSTNMVKAALKAKLKKIREERGHAETNIEDNDGNLDLEDEVHDDFAMADFDDYTPGGSDDEGEDIEPVGDVVPDKKDVADVGQSEQEKPLKFADLKDEDMICELIDIDVISAPGGSQRSGRSVDSAYEAVLRNPHLSAAERTNFFILHAGMSEDRRSELQKEVQEWEDYIIPMLEKEQSHKPFDVHQYGGEALSKFGEVGDTMDFSQLCKNKEKYEVSRVFLSMLMMANTNNVMIDHDPENPINSMRVTLLNRDRPHEKLGDDDAFESKEN